MLTGDLNDDDYRGNISEQLAAADLNMTDQILKTTGIKTSPSTRERGSKAIRGVFATVGVECKAAEVLQRGSGIGDYLVFMLNLCPHFILGNRNLRVVSPPGRTLRSDVYA